MTNLHKLYYKDYFNDIDWRDIKGSSRALQNSSLTAPGLLHVITAPESMTHQFRVSVIYPGLVTGIGLPHELGADGEFKLGVHFDWTWGMPVIYGSTVKGVLKSYFKDFYKGNSPDEVLNDIFEGGKKTIYDRDIFFDAVVVLPDKKGRILCSDSITPHGDNPLKNPIPITFLKIAPGCTLEFRFKLVDTKDKDGNTICSKDDKKKLFEKILTNVGIGAKTNVGYGQLKEV